MFVSNGQVVRGIVVGVCVSISVLGATFLISDQGGGRRATFADEPTKSGAIVDQLQWLAGHWLSEMNGETVEEQWLTPRGGLMLGVNRTVTKSGKTQFEFMRIAEKDGVLTFFASPSGRPATPFSAIQIEQDRVTFENPANDFPKKVIYSRRGDELHARIEGLINGVTRSLEWKWKRVP